MGRIAGVSPEETRERLVDAAARVVGTKGYERATVAEIAREAGVTTGAIYVHYGSKAELLVDALRCHGEQATAALFPPGIRMDAATVLMTLATQLGSADRDPAQTSLLSEALLASRRDDELAEVLVAALCGQQALIEAVMADGQAKGVLTDVVSPAVAARFGLMLGLGSMLVSDLDLPPVDPAEWATFIQRFIGAFTQGDQP
jgi:AcrR family transcriptional regulator